jgi:hypothetical protein
MYAKIFEDLQMTEIDEAHVDVETLCVDSFLTVRPF